MKTGDMNPTELANFIAKGIANNPGARHLPQFPTPVRHAALRAITGARSGSNRDFRGQVDKALFDVPAWWGKATPALAHSRRGDFNAGNPNYRGRSDPGANRTSFEEWKAAAGNIKLNDREVMNFMEYWVKYFVVKIETHLKAATPGRMKEMWGAPTRQASAMRSSTTTSRSNSPCTVPRPGASPARGATRITPSCRSAHRCLRDPRWPLADRTSHGGAPWTQVSGGDTQTSATC